MGLLISIAKTMDAEAQKEMVSQLGVFQQEVDSQVNKKIKEESRMIEARPTKKTVRQSEEAKPVLKAWQF